MKLITIFCFLFTYSLSLADVNDRLMLKAIRLAETNDQHYKIGRANEKTAYQFIKSTWRDYSNTNFDLIHSYSYKYEADRVAKLHLARIKLFLIKNHRRVNPSNIALVWNVGFTGSKRSYIPNTTKQYIVKVNGYYNAE